MSVANVARSGSVDEWKDAPPGLRWRILVSVIGPIAWISLTLLYVGFWSSGFSLFQSIIVVLVSILILAGVVSVPWIWWGPRYRGAWS